MTKLVRLFYTNTGLKGAPIDPKKPKLSVAFTAVRNDANEQVVEYGVASCVPADEFTRATGRAIATQNLEALSDLNSQVLADTPFVAASVTFPAEVNLDQLSDLIVVHYENAKRVHNLAEDAERKALLAEVSAIEDETEKLWAEHIEPRIKKAQALITSRRAFRLLRNHQFG